MVGPSFSPDERDQTARLLKAGFALLVGVSGALVAFQGGASVDIIGVAFVACLVVGVILTWFVARNLRAIQPEGMQKRRDRERRRR